MRIYVPSKMRSAKDMPSHTELKFRQQGQAVGADLMDRDLRAELEEKERKHFKSRTRDFEEERQQDLKLLEAAAEPGEAGAKPRMLVPKAVDADDEDDEDADDSDESDDDEDDEAELLAELERIKKERAEEAARKAAAEAAAAAAQDAKELARGNPLLQERLQLQGGDFTMKRRWDDDVVFKNQTRGEPKAQKRFINDTIRNDFHRRFLERYVK
ncbi:hypothetical protein N2152v2_010599 [Parachlorella kessleri]